MQTNLIENLELMATVTEWMPPIIRVVKPKAENKSHLLTEKRRTKKLTPLLPNPDHYLHNLITMTSSDSKRLWRRAIKEHFNCQCVYCGEFHELHNLTIDHVRPKCKGGTDTTTNVVPSCRRCNQDKGSREWLDWMRARFGQTDREHKILSHIK